MTFSLGKDEFLGHTGTMRMRLVDLHGVPVTGVHVALNDRQTGGGGEQVDAEGRITLRHLQPGRLDLDDLVLRPGIATEFAMAEFAGKGSVRIFWLDPPPPETTRKEVHIWNDSAKTYKLNLFPGRYALVAAAENGVAVREVDLNHAPAEPIRFDLRLGAPLRLENRVGAGYARLELKNAAGLPIRQRELSGTWSDVIRLPPGTYTATITGQDCRVTQRTVELTAAGATLSVP